jgi:small GTP-binding protein
MDIPPSPFDHSVKTIVVGDSACGKSSILVRFTQDLFSETGTTTMGVEFLHKIVSWNNQQIELQLWDTAGQERFRSVSRGYYRGSIGVFLIYDVTRTESFDHITSWFEDVRASADPNLVPVLIGNKSDLAHAKRVPRELGAKLAAELNAGFFEVSAKTGENVEAALTSILEGVVKLIEEGKYDTQSRLNSFMFGKEDSRQERQSGCC